MSNNQNRPVGRPKGTKTREPGRTSTVHVPERVRLWARHRCSIAQMVCDAPQWHDTMQEQAKEIMEMRENIAKFQALVQRLTAENFELLKFKDNVKKQMKDKTGLFSGVAQ